MFPARWAGKQKLSPTPGSGNKEILFVCFPMGRETIFVSRPAVRETKIVSRAFGRQFLSPGDFLPAGPETKKCFPHFPRVTETILEFLRVGVCWTELIYIESSVRFRKEVYPKDCGRLWSCYLSDASIFLNTMFCTTGIVFWGPGSYIGHWQQLGSTHARFL